ncbi:MAG: signal peptidase I [Cellulosilyticaceae bacterium]
MYKKIAYSLIGVVLLEYILQSTQLVAGINTAGVQWVYWGVVIILIGVGIPKVHGIGKRSKQHAILIWAFNIGAAYIVINLVAGVLLGFGKSPYNHSIQGIVMNSLTVAIPLVAREMVRAYSVNVFCRKEKMRPFVMIILVMTLTQISFARWLSVTSLEKFTILCAEQLLPRLCENILATYLVMYGGVKSSIVYLGMVSGFEWLSPILPNIDWLVKGIIGMLVPVIATVLVVKHYLKVTHHKLAREEEQENMWTFIPTALLAIGLIWFTSGLFPIYPSAIATGSMEPMIKPGDVILVEKISDVEDLNQLQVNEVIQFRRDDILITHRIVEIIEVDGRKEYRTKGDNNSAEDSRLVKMEEVKGRYKACIPKIGWPTLMFKQDRQVEREEVEF